MSVFRREITEDDRMRVATMMLRRVKQNPRRLRLTPGQRDFIIRGSPLSNMKEGK